MSAPTADTSGPWRRPLRPTTKTTPLSRTPTARHCVVLIKDLKVKGSSTVLKMGTKVKSIRLVGGDHEVDCKMEGGSFMLKACFLKKA